MTSGLFRSVLFVPGVRPDRFAKALASGADAVVFDLEDSVDASRKEEARDAIGAFMADALASPCQRLLRVNACESHWFRDDLDFVRTLKSIDGLVLPKAETPAQVEAAARSIGSRLVIPLLESARGILNAATIAMSEAKIPALLFGAEDLTGQIGVPRTVDGDELIFARAQVVLAATAIGAEAVDAVFIDINDADGLRRDAARARAMGFRGKMAIHPSQIAAIHDVFSPSAADIASARRIVDAYEAAQQQGEGVLRLDDRMVDAPVVARARKVLERAALSKSMV